MKWLTMPKARLPRARMRCRMGDVSADWLRKKPVKRFPTIMRVEKAQSMMPVVNNLALLLKLRFDFLHANPEIDETSHQDCPQRNEAKNE